MYMKNVHYAWKNRESVENKNKQKNGNMEKIKTTRKTWKKIK